MEYLCFNGNYIDKKNAKADIDDRGYQFGDGIYEVVRVYNGKISCFDGHIKRFYRSCSEIGIPISYLEVDILNMMNQLIVLNQIDSGIVYMQLTRGIQTRSHQYSSSELTPQLYMYTKSISRPVDAMKTGVRVSSAEDIRWLRCDIKSLNLLGNVMAKQKAVETGFFEAIFVRDGVVTEGSSSNFFIIKEGAIYTHPANHLILNGITRIKILELASLLHIPVIEQKFTMHDVLEADEAFLSSTINEVMPVTQIDNHIISLNPGTITKQLQLQFELDQEIHQKNEA